MESEGHEEKYRAVIEGEILQMNRSAKDGARLSLHYEGEGVTHPPIIPRCLRAARYGRFVCDPRRTCRVPVWQRISDPISESEMESNAVQVVGQPNSTRSAVRAA